MTASLNRKVIIVGSGIAGLSLAAYLQKSGCEVEIFEQAEHPGGVTATLSRNGFKWDLGPMMLEGIASTEPAGLALKEFFLDLELEITRGDRSLFFRGFSIQPDYTDPDRGWRLNRLASIFPNEKRNIRKFLRMMDRVNDLITLEKHLPFVDGRTRLRYRARMFFKFMRIRRYSRYNSRELVDLFFKTDELKSYFLMILADMTILPEEYPALALAFSNQENAYNKMIKSRKAFCGGPSHITYNYITGGNGVLIDYMVERFQKQGGRLHVSAPVGKIIVEDNRVLGIETSDGERIEADTVAVSGSAENCFLNMIGGEKLPDSWMERVKGLPLMESVFMIHLGIDFDPSEYQPMPLAYYYNTYDVEAGVERTRAGIAQQGDDGFLIYIPSYHSPEMAPPGRHAVTVFTIAPNRIQGGWEANKALHEDRLLTHAEKIIPELREGAVEKIIITPEDYGRMVFQLPHHSFGGVRPEKDNSGIPHKTPVENLWFIGSQSECGPGVWTQILAAKKISELMTSGN